MLDKLDVKILQILQKDCTVPVAEIGKKVGLSTTPCWRRIQKMEEMGVIRSRVALLDSSMVNAPVTVFVFITTNKHSETWLDEFHAAIERFPEVEASPRDLALAWLFIQVKSSKSRPEFLQGFYIEQNTSAGRSVTVSGKALKLSWIRDWHLS